MKKIMFNDRYGLTKAVLDGWKTRTSRIILEKYFHCYKDMERLGTPCLTLEAWLIERAPYKVGEVVAVAQSYNDSGWNPNTLQQTFVKEPTVFPDLDPISPLSGWIDLPLKYHKGWSNKMFVIAGLMPHQIRFTNVRAERLQDISEEDCLREGIERITLDTYSFEGWRFFCHDPREAFAALIDKVSGKGTWESNPWVYAYEFELVK